MKKHFLIANLKTNYHTKLDFQKVDQHTGGTWLIHETPQEQSDAKPGILL